jgi:VWFA-related protein
MRVIRNSVMRFLTMFGTEDEFFLVTFGERTQLVRGFTRETDAINQRLSFLHAVGKTPLLDGVKLALEEMKNARSSRRALLIISDGGDNDSSIGEGELPGLLRESGVVETYAIGLVQASPDTSKVRWPWSLLDTSMRGTGFVRGISEQGGGRMFEVSHPAEAEEMASRIAVEVRNAYILTIAANGGDGKFRSVKVEVKTPVGLAPVRAIHSPGYYVPKP